MTPVGPPPGTALALAGLALLALPPPARDVHRLHWLGGPAPARPSGAPRRLPRAVLGRWWLGPVAVGAAAAAVGGLILGLCGALVAAAAIRGTRAARAGRAVAADQAGLLESVAALTEELRSGRPPPAALAAAADARPTSWPGRALREAAAATALGGDPAKALRRCADAPPDARRERGRDEVAPSGRPGAGPGRRAARRGGAAGVDSVTADGLRRLAAAWQVSLRSGAPLADTLDRLERDLRDGARRRSRLGAELAGPRATAMLLAGLPAVGLLLGAGLGADPVHVLLGTGLGQAALLAGLVLDGLGLWWASRILASAATGGRR